MSHKREFAGAGEPGQSEMRNRIQRIQNEMTAFELKTVAKAE
ncbi:hypothetical protein [uncultured Aquimarina sp.]|nr:hypothetical protein [uncultured Aquimarina sp.]